MKEKVFIAVAIVGIVCATMASASIIKLSPGKDAISSALTTAKSGDVFELAAGVYWETNTINTPAGDLTIRGATGAEAIVYGPTKLTSANDLIHTYGNCWLQNLIFVGADSCRHAIMNYYGGVSTAGEEMAAKKNNIYISKCQFHLIGFGSKEGNVFYGSKTATDYTDGKFHPVDTLRVTDCFFYGGHQRDSTNWANEFLTKYKKMLPGWQAKTYKGIRAEERQARYVEVRRSTFWMLQDDPINVKGAYITSSSTPAPGSDVNYARTVIDHVTIYKSQRGDGIDLEFCNANQSITNSLVYITGRFSFKTKYGNSGNVVVKYCMGDSMNIEDAFQPPSTFYSQITQGPGCWPNTPPDYVDPEKGNFSLSKTSPAIGAADPKSPDGPNMGDPHYNKPETAWPNKQACLALYQKARAGSGTLVMDHSNGIAADFRLGQNYPNPFNPSTVISFSTQVNDRVILDVYNVSGRKIRTLVDENKIVGSYSIVWDGRDDSGRWIPSGVYFYRLRVGSVTQHRKMILMR